MRSLTSCLPVLLLPLLVAGCAGSGVNVAGLKDERERQVRVDTAAYQDHSELGLGIHGPEWYLRGTVGKDTRVAFHQLYVRTGAPQRRRWDEATALVDGALIHLDVETVDSSPRCSELGCIYLEDTVIRVEEAHLRHWAEAGGTIQLVSSLVEKEHLDLSLDSAEAREEIDKYLESFQDARSAI